MDPHGELAQQRATAAATSRMMPLDASMRRNRSIGRPARRTSRRRGLLGSGGDDGGPGGGPEGDPGVIMAKVAGPWSWPGKGTDSGARVKVEPALAASIGSPFMTMGLW